MKVGLGSVMIQVHLLSTSSGSLGETTEGEHSLGLTLLIWKTDTLELWACPCFIISQHGRKWSWEKGSCWHHVSSGCRHDQARKCPVFLSEETTDFLFLISTCVEFLPLWMLRFVHRKVRGNLFEADMDLYNGIRMQTPWKMPAGVFCGLRVSRGVSWKWGS